MDRVRHPFSTALALCALVAQLALPFAHEWQVARQEADHPLGFGSSGPGMAEDADSGHSHHDAELCRLCPALSQLRVALLGVAAEASFVPVPLYSLTADSRAFARDPGLYLALPRGPPQA